MLPCYAMRLNASGKVVQTMSRNSASEDIFRKDESERVRTHICVPDWLSPGRAVVATKS